MNQLQCNAMQYNRNVNDIARVLLHCFSLFLLWIIIVNSDIDYENNNNKERTKANKIMLTKNNCEWTKTKNIKQYHQRQDASEIMIFKYHNDIITSSMSSDKLLFKLLFKWHSKYKWVHLQGS